jgi:hypothetical protein
MDVRARRAQNRYHVASAPAPGLELAAPRSLTLSWGTLPVPYTKVSHGSKAGAQAYI